MPPFVERLSAWFKSISLRLKQRNWRVWAALAAITYVILEAVRALVSDASTALISYAWQFLQYLASQPMGLGGLAVVVFAVTLLAVSWFDSRPRRSPAPAEPQPLGEAERRLVQDIRTAWQRFGVLAVSQLSGILRDSQHALREREYWAELLQPVYESLEEARAQFEAALEPSQRIGIYPVRDRFNAMYGAYVKAMKWVAVLQSRGQLSLGSRPDERMAVWRQNHRDMIERLRDLGEDPSHRGTLHIYLNFISDPVFREFVTEAEMSRDWLALIRESQGPEQQS